MIDNMAEWAWSRPSVDEYWDNRLKDKSFKEQHEAINSINEYPGAEHLKEWLRLKIRSGIGKSVIKQYTIYENNKSKNIYWDIRDYETYMKFINRDK